jgi:hypothetical protein
MLAVGLALAVGAFLAALTIIWLLRVGGAS